MLKTDGIIFDVDGTLWDATTESAEAWNIAFEGKENVHITSDLLKSLFGKPMDQILAYILPECTIERREELATDIYNEVGKHLLVHRPKAYEGLEEAVKILEKKYPLFVVSNCQAGYIETLYEVTGLGSHFKDKLCYGDTGLYKAENIKIIIDKYGLKNPVYVGDTDGDRTACEEAGAEFVWATYGYGKDVPHTEKIDKLSELPDIFE